MEVPRDVVRRDRNASATMSRIALPALRLSLAVTYIWFGALKLAGESPVTDLVGKMSFGSPKGLFVKLMGAWECAIGVSLLLRLALRFSLVLFLLQLSGTFMVFIAHPGEAFRRRNPLLLTERGEFIVKNLVLLAAGLAVGSTASHGREEIPMPDSQSAGEAREVRV